MRNSRGDILLCNASPSKNIFCTRVTLLLCAKNREPLDVFDECVLFPIFPQKHLIPTSRFFYFYFLLASICVCIATFFYAPVLATSFFFSVFGVERWCYFCCCYFFAVRSLARAFHCAIWYILYNFHSRAHCSVVCTVVTKIGGPIPVQNQTFRCAAADAATNAKTCRWCPVLFLSQVVFLSPVASCCVVALRLSFWRQNRALSLPMLLPLPLHPFYAN